MGGGVGGGGGRLLEVGPNSQLGAYSNKCGSIPLFYRAVSGLVSRRCLTAGMSRTCLKSPRNKGKSSNSVG